ncbi:hypothetical protein RJC98_10250 [Pseudomonas allii]|uniref:Uncharacterized protein n=2 Tax=Pseudomonas allii TaxID=2740531 RepID=A0ACC6LAW7_9PSED|nr:hypothetical protein [Pseudomonas allii]KTB54748.1 hypothetical protein AO066_29110 [Pseudomonas fluorescens]MDR9875564.1 hypothetical protein [Pseudomonas allii]NWN46815.1 hypothetical protein [Pseudomonas allii]NWN59780.1 hypothetical protein [Pseudomonas allii]RMP80825.1 hypothetical protein ALQ17_02187 [Pseudomonas fluorescens]
MVTLSATGQVQNSMATPAYTIKNPEQVVNAFTKTEEAEAAETLKFWQQEQISELKSFLKGYDMTSISSDDLKKVGGELYDKGIIDSRAYWLFVVGNGAFDANGLPAETHVKFNAVALFNEQLEGYIDFFKSNPYVAHQEGASDFMRGLVVANHALAALAYFANSSNDDLSIDERA